MKRLHMLAAGALVIGLGATARTAPLPADPPREAPPAAAGSADRTVPGQGLPVQRVREYRMDGRIRPLLFWIGRNDVGSGRIVWRGGTSEGSAWELLIGSDPARAPRGLNRWGYIAEETGPGETRILGVMSNSDETSLQDVQHTLDGSPAKGRFKAIRARVQPGTSSASVGIVETERNLTLHDLAVLLERLSRDTGSGSSRHAEVPSGVRPGFLSAVAEVLHESVEASRGTARGTNRLEGTKVPYVYGRSLLDLTVKSVETVRDVQIDGRRFRDLLRTSFEIRARATGDKYKFELLYGTTGDLAEVPVVIRYQPRWWLEVQLTLDESRLAAR